MGDSVSGVNSGNRTSEVSRTQTDNSSTKTATTTTTKSFFNDTATVNNVTGANEKRGFNQADVTRTNLKAKAEQIPRMDAASERRLAQVNPQLANRIRRAAADLKAQGINVMVTSGYRSFAEQNALYAQGRTKPGDIVTKARGGQSLHNYGLAVDLVPLNSKGQPNWNVSESTWQKIGAAGKRQGLEWGGDWTGFKDRPHFQMTAGRSTSSLLNQYNQNNGNLQPIWNDVNSHYPGIGPNTPMPPTNPTNPTAPTVNGLEFGARGDKVTQLQRDLNRLGYPLQDDGVFGRKTDAAVKKFQRDHGLEPDGIVGSKTRAAIRNEQEKAALPVPTARLSKNRNSRGEQVKQLQNALVKLGFMTQAQMNTGPGTFGPRTDAALKAFQRSQNLTADGIYGPRSQAALRNALGGGATPVNPTNPTPPSTASGARINDILRGTNLAGKGDLIARLSQRYNIPAELALAMFRKEASFAANGSLAQRNNNPGNIRFVGQAGATRGASGFARWNSMDEGIEAYFGLLNRGYRSFIDNRDWAGMVNKYAPPSENNSTQYTRQITQWMGEYRQRLN